MFIGSCSGNFYALDREHGKPVWTYDATFDSGHPNFHGNAVQADDLIIVGTDDRQEGYLYAFDRATGEVAWQQAAPGGFPSEVGVLGSRVYAVTVQGEVRCIDLDTGKTRWSHGPSGEERNLRSGVTIDDDNVFATLTSGTVASFDPESGEVLWKTRLEARLNTTATVIGEELYVGDTDGRVHRISKTDGKVVGTIDGEAPVYGALLEAGDCLLALWGEDTLSCLEPKSGAVRWQQRTNATWSSFQPLVLADRVLVGTASGELHAFRLDDGSQQWMIRLDGELKGLGARGDVLYVGTVEGRVYAVPLEDARPQR